jgi:uncharacterized protein YqgC (DUF456 family)
LEVERRVDPLLAVALLVMAVGLVGTVVPGIPGAPLVFVAALGYALLTGFARVGAGHLVVYALLTALALALGLAANLLGARAFGASRWGILGAVVGLIVGIVIGGPVGLFVGPLVGAVALEALSGQTLQRALKSGVGAVVGFLLGSAAELAIALVMVISFVHATLLS